MQMMRRTGSAAEAERPKPLSQNFEVDFNEKKILLGQSEQAVALALIRKDSGPFGLFGYVYFLEVDLSP